MANIVEPNSAETPDRFIRRVVITVAIVSIAYILWEIREVAMILFGGILLATLLVALGGYIQRFTPLKDKAAVGIALLLIVLLFSGLSWWIGDSVVSQMEELREKLPKAVDATHKWLLQTPFGGAMPSDLKDIEDMEIPWADVAGFTGTALGALANFILILAIGIYIALSPGLYSRGLVRLFPLVYRARTEHAFLHASAGLRSWLLGQLVTMIVIGIVTTIGLYALDIPLALSLGIIAGLLEFVPFVGPIVFGALAVLLAFIEGPTAALHVALLVLALQQLEGNVVTPLVQRRTVKLPPALGLIAVVIFGVLFGIPGILFATPLIVVVMILVKKLYVEAALEGREIENEELPQT